MHVVLQHAPRRAKADTTRAAALIGRHREQRCSVLRLPVCCLSNGMKVAAETEWGNRGYIGDLGRTLFVLIPYHNLPTNGELIAGAFSSYRTRSAGNTDFMASDCPRSRHLVYGRHSQPHNGR
jgi:hypothetical protein